MIQKLTTEEFRNKIFDYENNKNWKYSGNQPAILDFYADWCGPCKMLSPILEDIQKQYNDKIVIYKINTEEEFELAKMFDIRSIPSLLFIPLNKEPNMSVGLLNKDQLIDIIDDVLLK